MSFFLQFLKNIFFGGDDPEDWRTMARLEEQPQETSPEKPLGKIAFFKTSNNVKCH
jgi:hypothetical protein